MSDIENLVNSIRAQRKKVRNRPSNDFVQPRKVYDKYRGCDICNGTLYDEDGNMCECMKHHIMDLKYMETNIGEKYYDVNMQFYKRNMGGMQVYVNNERCPRNVDFFARYIKLYINTFENRLSDGKGFLLSGECGCGKTGALCFVIKTLKLKGF